jgi:uncharacterized protein YdeI (YjbR/CyaY-like superfamily)
MKTHKGVAVPQDLADALRADSGLGETFERMRPSCQREYAGWVDAAKTHDTRARRIASVLTAVTKWGGRHTAKAH